jgi:alpha-2-macroglobulin
VRIEGRILDTLRTLGGGNKEVSVPLADLRGKTVVLRLEGENDTPSAFTMEARYARPDAASPYLEKRQPLGPTIHRVYTDAKGEPVDLAKLGPGDVVRVALRAEVKPAEGWRGVYLAVTDRFAGGFEPVETDLASVASVPDVGPAHPFYGHLGTGHRASHVDVRNDRVNVYFDHAYGAVYATYLLRAVTPGTFAMPPARGELMYEPGSEGYSDATHVTIR